MLLRMVLTVWRWWPTLGGVIYKYIKMLVRMLMTVWRWWWWLTLNGAICSFWKNIKIFLRMVMTVWWWWWLTLGGAICTSPAAGADDTTDLGFRTTTTTTTTHYSTDPHPCLGVWENWYYMLSQVSGIWHKIQKKDATSVLGFRTMSTTRTPIWEDRNWILHVWQLSGIWHKD